jgi:SAM-dependent methyltransferase
VLEHVADDRQAVAEMARVLKPGGRAIIFVPNRGYPFETHGIYWRGKYHFGNIPLVNYLPRRWRDRLAPHVRVYSSKDMQNLFAGLPVQVVERSVVFGAYDNIIARFGPCSANSCAQHYNFLKKRPCKGWDCPISGWWRRNNRKTDAPEFSEALRGSICFS